MNCEIHAPAALTSAAIAEHVTARIRAAVGRFAGQVTRVRVRLDDINGPRHKGPDKQCTVDLSLAHGGRIIVRDLRDDLYAAITGAANRAKSVLTRRLGRRRRS